MSTSPIWRGSTEIELSPDTPRKITTLEGTTYIVKYEGPAAAIDAAEPAPGYLLPGALVPVTHSVSQVIITPASGGRKIMEITLAMNEFTGGGTTGPGATDTTSYDLDINQLVRPIEAHPYYSKSGSHTEFTERLSDTITLDAEDEEGNPIPDTPSTNEIDIDVPLGVIWDQIKRLPLKEARRLYLRIPTANRPIITDLWAEWAAGQDSYLAFAPQARAQDYSNATPDVGDFGKTTTPPTGIAWPSGFEALRAGGSYSRPKKTGRFRREIVYLGAPDWPAKFYPPA